MVQWVLNICFHAGKTSEFELIVIFLQYQINKGLNLVGKSIICCLAVLYFYFGEVLENWILIYQKFTGNRKCDHGYYIGCRR